MARTSPRAVSAAAISNSRSPSRATSAARTRPRAARSALWQAQRHPGRVDYLGRLGPRQGHPSSGHEAAQALDALAADAVGVADVGEDDPPGPSPEQVTEAAVQAGEDQVELADHLICQCHPGGDLAPAVGHPGGLGGQCVGAHRREPPGASHHQLGHRPQVTGVALQPAQQLLGPGILDRCWVELDDLVAAGPQPCHQVRW